MKISHQNTIQLNALLLLATLVCQGVCNSQQTDTLEQRLKNWDVAAIKEAADQGRKDLVPLLEQAANASIDPDEPAHFWATAALAKLGVKKYLDETVVELTTTNSPLFQSRKKGYRALGMSEDIATKLAKYEAQETAFKKLAYIRDPSTVKIVASFLYNTENLNQEVPKGGDVLYGTPSGFAYMALRQMVDSPPALPAVRTHEEELRAWQQWWEQNKDKYP